MTNRSNGAGGSDKPKPGYQYSVQVRGSNTVHSAANLSSAVKTVIATSRTRGPGKVRIRPRRHDSRRGDPSAT